MSYHLTVHGGVPTLAVDIDEIVGQDDLARKLETRKLYPLGYPLPSFKSAVKAAKLLPKGLVVAVKVPVRLYAYDETSNEDVLEGAKHWHLVHQFDPPDGRFDLTGAWITSPQAVADLIATPEAAQAIHRIDRQAWAIAPAAKGLPPSPLLPRSSIDRLSGTRLKGAAMAAKWITTEDAYWNLERQAFNILIDQQPAGIAMPRSVDDVSEIVRAAAEEGKRVAAQRTGHLATPLGSLADTVLLRTAGLGGVQIDGDAGRARVGAGALWGELVPAASDQGLAALHGSSPTVCIAGYTLGGGVSFYGRKYGLACSQVTAIELVTASGEQIRVDADNEPDLFWALRGGGGSFGVVTALEFNLLPLREIYAGALFFPAEQAGDVLHGWHEWTDDVPEEMTSVGRLMNFPPIPEVPDPLRGNSFAVIEVIYCGDPADGEELVAPLRALGNVGMDTMAVQPPAGITELHMDPPEPVPYWADSMLVGELAPAAVDSLLEAVGPGSGSQLVSVELRHCGGALARPASDSGALASIPGSFLAFGVGFVPVPEAMTPTRAWLAAFKASLEPYDAGRYLNFSEERFEMTQAFPAQTVDRLREVKQRYDQDDLFQSNHPVTG